MTKPPKIGKVTISRNSSSEIRICFRDELSGIEFATVTMTAEDFGMAVTGAALSPGVLEVQGLQNVGKRRVNEARSVICPLDTYDKKQLSAWLEANAQEEGWKLNTFLGTQNAVVRVPTGLLLHYSVTKFVDVTV